MVEDTFEEVAPVREEFHRIRIELQVHDTVETVLHFGDEFHVLLAEHQGVVGTDIEGGTGGGLDEGAHME